MRLSSSLKVVVIAGLLLGGSAFAARKPQDFQEPAKMSEEELAAAKARSRSNINVYGEVMEQKPKPFPWVAVTLIGLIFLVATPFALRSYRNTAREIAGNKAFGASTARANDD